MKKRNIRILSIISLVIGIFLIFNSKTNITGAVIDSSSISSTLSSVLGVLLILVSLILFIFGENLEEKLEDSDYSRLKKHLAGKGEIVVKKEAISHISFEKYKDILDKKVYDNFPLEMKDSYKNDREEYFERLKHNSSDANRYLFERLKEINSDPKRVSELTLMIHNKEKKYDKVKVEDERDKLLKRYTDKEIDEYEFADKLNEVGELTGGVYNPGNNHLSVKIMGHPTKMHNQGNNPDLARAIHTRILANSPRYKPDCEFHYSKQESTKHHN